MGYQSLTIRKLKMRHCFLHDCAQYFDMINIVNTYFSQCKWCICQLWFQMEVPTFLYLHITAMASKHEHIIFWHV